MRMFCRLFSAVLLTVLRAGVAFLSSCAVPGSGVKWAKREMEFESSALRFCEDKGFNPDSAQFANCVKDTKWNLPICHAPSVRSMLGRFAADELLTIAQTLLPSEECKK